MYLSPTQRNLIERVINTIETGDPNGDYGAISIYADGPHDIRQITYGRAQTTEYGNLRKLVQMYVAAGGIYSNALSAYAGIVGSEPLTDDSQFKKLLRDAGRKDPVMKKIQDQFFEEVYFLPAMRWADDNGFMKALSSLVIYDSFIHSGQIFWFLRQRFAENPPAQGGNEETWIGDYVRVRHDWLSTHHRSVVRKSNYRTKAFMEQITNKNWELAIVPIKMNNTDVYPTNKDRL
jgi:chitosanase